MPFIEGFVTAVPTSNREAFCSHVAKAARVFQGCDASRVVDAWGDNVPKGKTTDFYRAVDAREDETVGFGWIEYADRAARDAAWEKMKTSPDMAEIGEMPFDGHRMIFGGFEPVVEQGKGGKTGYVEGFVMAVPETNKEKFITHAAKAAPFFLSEGALRVVECWGVDVPKGKVTDFYRSVKAEDDEAVVFSWVEWPDKMTKDAGQAALFEKMETHMKDNPMPFDGKRLIYGGFEIINDARE